MAPPVPTIDGRDCGGPLGGDFSAGISAAVTERAHKCPTSLDVRESLQDHASSPPEAEAAEWNETSSARLDEAGSPSALRGRLLHLDLNPSMVQGTLSETSPSRRSSSIRHHGEGYQEPHATHDRHHQSHNHHPTPYLLLNNINTTSSFTTHTTTNTTNRHHLLAEDAMDMSDAGADPTDGDGHLAAQRLASTIPSWDGERPCRANPNSNHDMALFLSAWRLEYEFGNVPSPITSDIMNIRQHPRQSVISSVDVVEGHSDMQGVNWASYGTRISEVKSIRSRYHQHPHIRQHPTPPHAQRLPDTERVFRFQQTATEARPWIEHYQLCNLVATTSYNDVHYVSRSKVMSISPSNPRPYCVMDLDTSSDPFRASSDFHVTALASAGSALIAGGFRGEFAVQDLTSEFGTQPVTGYVSNQPHAITNHIHSFNSRSNGYPLAAFCSNDRYLRTLDLSTNRVLSSIFYDDVMNCSATSPNGRLRALAGDFEGALIVDADSGRVLEHATGGSRGHGFACAWADNDIHVATAGQDCQVLVWDARNWSLPLATIATENTYASSLRFSPLGGGSPVLVVAETADAVSIVEARTYGAKQTISVFGDIAGTSLSADGAQLTIAAGDKHLGGLLTFQREDFGGVTMQDGSRRRNRRSRISSSSSSAAQRSDWLQECELEFHPRVRLDAKARRRRGLRLDDMFI